MASDFIMRGYNELASFQIVSELITKYGNNPNYRVKKKASLFYGYSIDDLS